MSYSTTDNTQFYSSMLIPVFVQNHPQNISILVAYFFMIWQHLLLCTAEESFLVSLLSAKGFGALWIRRLIDYNYGKTLQSGLGDNGRENCSKSVLKLLPPNPTLYCRLLWTTVVIENFSDSNSLTNSAACLMFHWCSHMEQCPHMVTVV